MAQGVSISTVFSSPPSPVGAGARATGFGSAFIAIADDATAASWNPGGLTQLESPEMSAVGRGSYQKVRYGAGSRTGDFGGGFDETISTACQTDSFGTIGLNFLSGTMPFTVADRNLVVSMSYQQMISFDHDLHYNNTVESPGGTVSTATHLEEEGGLDAATLSMAFDVLPDLAIGASANYWFDSLIHPYAWREHYTNHSELIIPGIDPIVSDGAGQFTVRGFNGLNGTFEFLWKLPANLALGGVVKMPVTSDLTRVIRSAESADAPDYKDRFRLHLPTTVGGGVSWAPADNAKLSADVTYVDWGSFRVTDSTGASYLVTGDPVGEYDVDGTITGRIGGEYIWMLDAGKLAARGGLFYDPEPTRGAPRPLYGAGLGLGFSNESFAFDLAYQARFGFDVRNTTIAIQILGVPSVEADIFQNFFYASLIKYF
ncbi:MAG: hypothetical protein IPK07_08290 [Deltaproteobacteria bacterium]|nr:hypothetical protein [Deltaproteobacteria bacterium]